MRQRKVLARALAAVATAFLIAGVTMNLAFLAIGCFLMFGAFLASRPASGDAIFLRDSPSSHIEGTIAYELKWGKQKDPFPPYSS